MREYCGPTTRKCSKCNSHFYLKDGYLGCECGYPKKIPDALQ